MWPCISKSSEDDMFKSSHMLSGVSSQVLCVYEPRPSIHLDGSVLKGMGVREELLRHGYARKFSWQINNDVFKKKKKKQSFRTSAFSCFAESMSPLDSLKWTETRF